LREPTGRPGVALAGSVGEAMKIRLAQQFGSMNLCPAIVEPGIHSISLP
jgi:hypothetical protein